MDLTTLVFYIRNGHDLSTHLNVDSELDMEEIDVFMEDKLEIRSNLHFFDVEEIQTNEFEMDGVKLIELLPLNMIIEAVNAFITDGLDDITIANRILNYRINDA
jgi:hypothetical protein